MKQKRHSINDTEVSNTVLSNCSGFLVSTQIVSKASTVQLHPVLISIASQNFTPQKAAATTITVLPVHQELCIVCIYYDSHFR